MQAGRPGGPRAGRHDRRDAATGRAGAGWRLACLAFVVLALSGHSRRLPPPASDAAARAVAEVVLEQDGAVVARGSGVVVAAREEGGEPACYLLTVAHVVAAAGGSKLIVMLPADDGGAALPGELVVEATGDDRDLAVVRVVAPGCHPVPIGPSVESGADLWLAGFPALGSLHVWTGHVRDAPSPAQPRWTVDGAVTEGASGGGVFDASTGGLVGLIQGYWTVRLVGPAGPVAGEVAAGTTAVIPVARVRALLREWGLDALLDE